MVFLARGLKKAPFPLLLRLFLLRDSQSNPKAFVLTLCHHQKIKHFQILPVSPAEMNQEVLMMSLHLDVVKR